MRRGRRAAALVVAIGALVLTYVVASAWADDPSDTAIVAQGSGQCAAGTAQIGHGSTGSNAFALSLTGVYNASCSAAYNKVAGNIRARAVLQKKAGGDWGSCRDTGIYVNAVTNYFAFIQQGWGTEPCGGGAYRVKSFNHVKWDGDWHGGDVYSPSHSWPGG